LVPFEDLRASIFVSFVDLRVYHQRVSWIFALEDSTNVEPFGQHGRHVLAAVDGQVDITAQQRIFNFLDEQPFAPDFGQRGILQTIAGGFDDDDVAAWAIQRLDPGRDESGLKKGELTAAAAEAKRGH
jgi:hypothetical protein